MLYYPIDTDDIPSIIENCKISILSVNIRSLNKNYDHMAKLIKNCLQPDILLIQETWHPSVFTSHFSNYNPPTLNLRRNRAGGGCGIWTKIKHKSEPCPLLQNLNLSILEIAATIVKIKHNKLLTISIYRPPNTDLELAKNDLIKIIDSAENLKLKFIIGGDINIDYLINSHTKTQYETILSKYNLTQTVVGPTRISKKSKTCIDHIIVKDSTNATSYTINETLADHLAVLTCIDTNKNSKNMNFRKETNRATEKTKEELCISKTLEDLKNHDWDDWKQSAISNNLSSDEIFNSLHSIITSTIDKNTTKSKLPKKPKKPWTSQHTILLHQKANKARKDYLKKPSPSKYLKFKQLKDEFRKNFKIDKNVYYNNKFNMAKSNPKMTWSIINEILNRNLKLKDTGIPEIFINNKSITSPTEICDTFNDYYKNIATKVAEKIPKGNIHFHEFIKRVNKPTNKFCLQEVTNKEVLTTVKKFKSKDSYGYDNISPRLLKELSPPIISPLTFSINKCLKSNFPEILKIGKLTPLLKKGDPKECGNYRPISQNPSNSKLIEQISGKQLNEFLNKENIIHPYQFGFLKGHSTNHALMLLTNKIEIALRKKMFTIVVCCDLSKAFDCINTEEILPYKLNHYFSNIETEKFFLSFFQNRKQFVQIGQSKSKITNLHNIGTVQGATLSPIFYNIYSNCLEKATKLDIIAYADDSNFIASNRNLNEVINKINTEMINVKEYMNCNKLSLNTSKTVALVIQPKSIKKVKSSAINLKIGTEPINIEKNTKFLGITIDEKFNFNDHYANILPKIKSGIRALQLVKYTLPYQAKLTIYHSLVHSHLNYCALIWLRKLSKNKKLTLFNLQKKAVRAIFKANNKCHTDPLFLLSGITKIENICKNESLKIMVQYKENLLPSAIKNMISDAIDNSPRNTRSQNSNELKIKTTYFQGMLVYDLLAEWNKCNSEIKYRTYPLQSYYQRIKKYTQTLSQKSCNESNCINCKHTDPDKFLKYMD